MPTPPDGHCFGRYVVSSQLGVGGMGVVYAAVDTHLQRQVALKVVSAQHAGSPEFRERFQREAATVARLDSPHIIAIFDHGEEAGQPYLATQLVRGGDLGQLLEARGPLPPTMALSVCAQVADALTDAHAAGVVHRDIKPSSGTPVRYRMSSDGTSSFDTVTEPLDVHEVPVYVDWDDSGTTDRINPVYEPTSQRLELDSDDPTLDGTTYDGIEVVDSIAFVDAAAGDVDGDGAPDLVVWGQSGARELTVWVLRHEGGRFGDPVEWLRLPRTHTYTAGFTVGDFDGDGSADLVGVLPTGVPDFAGAGTTYDGPRGTQLFASTGTSFTPVGALNEDRALLLSSFLVLGDYAGDGTPLVALSGDGGGPPIMLVFGVSETGLLARPALTVELPDPSGFLGGVRAAASDVDGDGDDDLVMTKKRADRAYLDVLVALSDGDSFRDPTAWAPTPRCEDSDNLCFWDFQDAY